MIGSYWYVTTEWKRYYTEDEIKTFVKEIDKAPKFSDTFYRIYDKLHNNERHKSITSLYFSAVWNEIILDKHQYETSWFVRSANFFPMKKGIGEYLDFKLAWGLEKYTTPEKCFDFVKSIESKQMMRYDTTFKDITKLKDTTAILEYLVKLKAPSLYRRNPERLNQRILELRRELNQ